MDSCQGSGMGNKRRSGADTLGSERALYILRVRASQLVRPLHIPQAKVVEDGTTTIGRAKKMGVTMLVVANLLRTS